MGHFAREQDAAELGCGVAVLTKFHIGSGCTEIALCNGCCTWECCSTKPASLRDRIIGIMRTATNSDDFSPILELRQKTGHDQEVAEEVDSEGRLDAILGHSFRTNHLKAGIADYAREPFATVFKCLQDGGRKVPGTGKRQKVQIKHGEFFFRDRPAECSICAGLSRSGDEMIGACSNQAFGRLQTHA